ncbi:hypothetical protein L227DRAFT_492187 [Lentinus tigrinus ALCF2SS1-6]|uniref:C2H2-type domain-containing protein n=1 Tax=Lentinus tigrinus ALCF2SS1-6 TaxID=1328759 RepID=A0A5C2T648_9APHY|nr:hypothetical protein L227DRAFT_492187 [Lentinus tigrinus ALCF2SS1-6]
MSVSELLRPSPGPPLGFGTPEQSSTSSLVGLYADVNMREVAWRSKSPAVCVNPADVMTGSLMYPSPTMDLSPVLECKEESPLSPVALLRVAERSVTPPPRSVPSPVPDYISDFPQEGLVDDEDFPDEAISAIVSVLQTTVKSEHQHTPIPAAVRPTETCLKENQPLYPQHAQRVPLADLPIPQPEYTGPPHTSYYSYGAHQHPTTYTFAPPPPPAPVRAPAPGPPLSPVLNAHTGISLEELRQRANDYRTRHEGADLDKNFLQCFAGRLSARGEMLDEYRCYVTGCEQRNKRRDHILVHVGAHVEHRPWMCRHCGMRFLRKNECKRHEAGHGGRKPFSCSLCAPYQEKSFVRQDLLKRHLRVAHGAQGTVARKKKGVYKDEDEDYWP